MDTIGLIKKGLIIAAVSALIACGGGGGSAGPTYSGKTGTAKITADNASELTGAVIGGAGPASGGSASVTGNGAQAKQGRNRAIGFGRSLTRATRSASADYQGSSASTTAALVPADETIPGECGGEMVITGSYDDDPTIFDVDLTITFNDYCFDGTTPEEGSILNGVVTVKGKEYADDSFDWTQTFTNLSYKNKTESMTLNGNIAAVGTDTSFSVEMTYDFTDHIAGKTYRVENLKVSINESGDFITATISGKVYHPDYGSYSIETDPALKIYYADDYPVAGKVTIRGAEGTFASAEYHPYGTYTLTIYDGETTTVKTCDSVTGVCN